MEKRIRKTSSGFTLIELLVVIAIIGILSSIVLASLNSARSKARDVRRMSDIGQLQLALEFYYDANGTYPNIPQSSDTSVCENRWPTLDTYLSPYIKVPHDPLGPPVSYPASRYCYFYGIKNGGQGYVIMAYQVESLTTAAKGEGATCYPDTTNVYCKGVNY